MIKHKNISKIDVVFVVILLLFLVGCSPSTPSAPTPTPTPLPNMRPPSVNGWEGANVETICLETGLGLGRVDPSLADPIGEAVRGVLTNMGIRIASSGDTCDATMVIKTLVHPRAATYEGYITCYTGGSLHTEISLTREGQETIFLPVTAETDPGKQVLAMYCEQARQPEDFLKTNTFYDLWEEPLLNALVDLWGEQALVWALDVDVLNTYGYPNTAKRKLLALGPTDEVVLALIHAMRTDNHEDPSAVVFHLRWRATDLLSDFAPEAEAAIPYLAQATMDPDLRGPAILALEKFGPLAMDAVPMLITVLKDTSERLYVHSQAVSALEAITGQDLGDSWAAWYRWDRRR